MKKINAILNTWIVTLIFLPSQSMHEEWRCTFVHPAILKWKFFVHIIWNMVGMQN